MSEGQNRSERLLQSIAQWLAVQLSNAQNGLRSSREVNSVFNNHVDWYAGDTSAPSNVITGRLLTIWSCLRILVLALPSELATDLLREAQHKAMEDLQTKSVRNRATRSIGKAPGHRLLKVTEYFFSPKTVILTFKPLVADWHCEYFAALTEKRFLLARCISIRYYWYFAKAFGLSKVARLFKVVAKS